MLEGWGCQNGANRRLARIMLKISLNRILNGLVLLLFVNQFVVTNISFALSNRLVKDKEDKQYMTEQLKLEIELNNKIYKLNEPIMIKGKIENLTKKTIYLSPVLFMDLLVYLKYEDEQEVVPFGPKVLLYELIKKENIIKLQAGESHHFERIISKELYIMPNKIGQYELYVIYSNKMGNLEGIELWTGELKSNVIRFEVK
jgi:hypothetical protein